MSVTRVLRLCALAMAAALFSVPAAAQLIRIMSGPQGGSWYPLAAAIQTIVEKNVPGTSVRVAPGAGISNVLGVENNKAEMGFGNSVSTFDGVHGNDPFKKKTDNVCHIATLYFQYFHVVAIADAGIRTVADINGKILTTQQKGNTGEQMTRDLLKVYGLDYAKLRKVNFGSYNDSVEQMKDGHAQVFALITTIPASAVMDIGTSRKITIVAVPDEKLRALQKINKGYDKRIIKAGTYSGMDKDVQTIGTWTHLMMRCSTPEDLVYKITKSLAANTSELGNVVAAVKGLTAKELAIDVGVPYHPGARKFYREAKVL
jgi:TRAP transporter TAXI family solute receptor